MIMGEEDSSSESENESGSIKAQLQALETIKIKECVLKARQTHLLRKAQASIDASMSRKQINAIKLQQTNQN